MNIYSYLAKQEFLPLAKLIAVLAEYKVINDDVAYGNYDFQYRSVVAGYTSSFVEYRECFCTKQSVEETDETKILVDVESFVAWADEKQIPMPNEFLVLIDKCSKGRRYREAELDKNGIQVLATALWDMHPDWTKEQIKKSKYVQVYGGGSQWPDKTVLKWLAGVDPRDSAKKTGPKKNCS